MDFNVDFYRKVDGESPVEHFLDSLNIWMRAKALRAISMLSTYGNALREPYSKPLRDGIFELWISPGSDIAMMLYFFSEGHLVILTNGFVKKTQKAPSVEIETALKYKADWLERRKLNE